MPLKYIKLFVLPITNLGSPSALRPMNSPELVISSPVNLPQRIAPLSAVTESVPFKFILSTVIPVVSI